MNESFIYSKVGARRRQTVNIGWQDRNENIGSETEDKLITSLPRSPNCLPFTAKENLVLNNIP